MIHRVSNPILEQLILTLRDPQTGRKEFRETLERVGAHLAIEISKVLPTRDVSVTTVMNAVAMHQVVAKAPLIMPILRAGLPLWRGLQNVFPDAGVGFIGAMRNEESVNSEAKVGYTTTPEEITGSVVILADTMVATGGSILETIQIIKHHQPGRILLAAVIAARQGLETIQSRHPDVDMFVAAIDPQLDSNNYIVPGLGDAGDRCYGGKKEKCLE
jgi:uracil phosphoribosyltransferase